MTLLTFHFRKFVNVKIMFIVHNWPPTPPLPPRPVRHTLCLLEDIIVCWLSRYMTFILNFPCYQEVRSHYEDQSGCKFWRFFCYFNLMVSVQIVCSTHIINSHQTENFDNIGNCGKSPPLFFKFLFFWFLFSSIVRL